MILSCCMLSALNLFLGEAHMATPKVSLDYLAGFFDGEGTVGVYRLQTGFRLRCSVANTERVAVDVFHERYGGKIRSRHYRNDLKWKPAWIWELDFRNAVVFLEEMLPYLIVKKLQAQIALELYKLVPPRSPRGQRQEKYKRLTKEDRAQRAKDVITREVMIDYIKALNARGKGDAVAKLMDGVDTSCGDLHASDKDTPFDIAMRRMAALAVHRMVN